MSLEALTDEEKAKVTQVVAAGEQVLEEMDGLKEDLKEYVKDLSEELDIKPAAVNKAIRLAHKQRKDNAIEKTQEEMDTVERILVAAGRLTV